MPPDDTAAPQPHAALSAYLASAAASLSSLRLKSSSLHSRRVNTCSSSSSSSSSSSTPSSPTTAVLNNPTTTTTSTTTPASSLITTTTTSIPTSSIAKDQCLRRSQPSNRCRYSCCDRCRRYGSSPRVRGKHGHRRELCRRLALFLTLFLQLPSSSWPNGGLGLTEAVACISPTYTTTVQPGETMVLAWKVSALDRIVFDTLSAELYCMDTDGPESGQWRPAGTLFSDLAVQPPAGEYPVQVPNCGPRAGDGSIKIVAKGLPMIGLQKDDSCYFSIKQASAPEELLPIARPFLPLPVVGIIPTSTNNFDAPPPSNAPTNGYTNSDKRIAPTATTAFVGAPRLAPFSPNPGFAPPVTTTVITETSYPMQTSTTIPQAKLTSTDYVSTYTGGPLSTEPPVITDSFTRPISTTGLLYFPTPRDTTVERSENPIKGIVGGLIAAACLIILAVILVMRRRMKNRTTGSSSRSGRKGLSKMMHRVSVGGPGAIMKETKRKLRLGSQPKEGYFFKMDDQDDDEEDDHYHHQHGQRSVRSEEKNLGTPAMSEISARRSGTGGQPPLTFPPHAHLSDTTSSLPRHTRGGSTSASRSPFDDPTTSRPGSMSSRKSKRQSYFETSSTARKNWASAMAARAERLVAPDNHYHHLSSASSSSAVLPRTRDIEQGYEEGSIFGDGHSINSSGRDSESRMADILSLRTTGSGADTIGGASSRYRYRRSTLNSMGNSSFGLPHGTATPSTGTLSSIPDSLMISEEEFNERIRMHEIQMRLEQEYYDRYFAEHPDGEDYQSTISRSNSIPSLTSSNDPFKTFDSNEVLVDMDTGLDVDDDAENPFSDDRAHSPIPHHQEQQQQQQQQQHSHYPYSHRPYPHRHP